MAKSNSSTSLHNQGENRGIMASEIHGPIDNSQHTTIIYSERETQKKLPSLIPQIVETLAEITVLSDDEIDKIYRISKEELTSYNIGKKITHNNLILYKEVIEEYSQYGLICERAFNIVDDYRIGAKGKILRDIKHLYRRFKGKVLKQYQNSDLAEMDIIRNNADNIIDMIKDELEKRILEDTSTNILVEDLEDGLIRILCYSFVECKILERPR